MDSFHIWQKWLLAWEVVSCRIWPWPIFSRSFSHDFAIKLLKYGTLALSALHHVQFWMDSFPIWHKWSLAWEDVSRGQRWRCYRSFEFLRLGVGGGGILVDHRSTISSSDYVLVNGYHNLWMGIFYFPCFHLKKIAYEVIVCGKITILTISTCCKHGLCQHYHDSWYSAHCLWWSTLEMLI